MGWSSKWEIWSLSAWYISSIWASHPHQKSYKKWKMKNASKKLGYHVENGGLNFFPFAVAMNILHQDAISFCELNRLKQWQINPQKRLCTKRCAQQEVVLTNKSLGLDPGKILTHNETRLMVETHYGWWFQPTWNIVVKLGIFPQVGVKIKNMWNYQLLFVGQAFGPSTKTLQWLIGRISRVDAPNTELIEGQQNHGIFADDDKTFKKSHSYCKQNNSVFFFWKTRTFQVQKCKFENCFSLSVCPTKKMVVIKVVTHFATRFFPTNLHLFLLASFTKNGSGVRPPKHKTEQATSRSILLQSEMLDADPTTKGNSKAKKEERDQPVMNKQMVFLVVWGPVVWDLNLGEPPSNNPFHFQGSQDSKPPGPKTPPF